MRADVPAPALLARPGARLVDVDVRMAADGTCALFGFAVAVQGATGTVRVRHALMLVDAMGCVLATAEGDPDVDHETASIHGACVTATRVLMPTPAGVLALRIEPARITSSTARAPGTLVPATLFATTAPFVDAGCALISCGDGALCVAAATSVQRLQLLP